MAGFGQVNDAVEKAGMFWAQTDPVMAYIKGWQRFLSVTPTGVWNLETHTALYRWLANNDPDKFDTATAWGADPNATAKVVATGPFEDLEEEDQEAVAATFGILSPLFGQLGLPTALDKFQTLFEDESNMKALTAQLPQVSKTISAAESVPLSPGTPSVTPLPDSTGGGEIVGTTPNLATTDGTIPWGKILLIGAAIGATIFIVKAMSDKDETPAGGTGGCGCGAR